MKKDLIKGKKDTKTNICSLPLGLSMFSLNLYSAAKHIEIDHVDSYVGPIYLTTLTPRSSLCK